MAVIGPTATGKSDLGVRIAAELGGQIVNADASQFYRGMDVGTAKLSQQQRGGIAHHQIDVLDIADEARVAAYQQSARIDVAAIRSMGDRPVVVGGSGLYLRALLDQLDIPPTDPRVRARYENALAERGADALHAELTARDPVAASRLDARNQRRVVRALEVIELTGKPFSASMPRREFVEPAVMIGLSADRPVLNARIRARIDGMWLSGFLEEVKALDANGLRDSPTARRALGYSQALAHLDGRLDAEQARGDTAIATRKYARRQMAWFRPDPRITWLPHDAPDLLAVALKAVESSSA